MFFQAIKMAWSAIRSNKMRSFLTMLGIIIGVASLTILVSVVNGATGSVTDSISSLGNNLLTVTITDDKENPLHLSELNDFADGESVDQVAAFAQTSVTAKSGYTSDSMTVYGTTGSYYDIQGLQLQNGRWLNKADVDNNTYVAVINAYAATELIGRTDCVGETISLNGMKYQIIGVLDDEEDESLASSLLGSSETMEAYIPYTSLTRLADSILYVTSFYASPVDENDMDAAEAELEEKLLDRFDNDEDAFNIMNVSAIADTMESVTSMLGWMLGGIAAISLIVGGIGIMNIMLVSVTERTREIGIRKAIGAGRGNIMAQFLIEALMLSLLGCLIGVVISVVVLRILGVVVTSMSFALSPSVLGVAAGFSAFIGVVFGIYPANKAAKKHPIEALRYSE